MDQARLADLVFQSDTELRTDLSDNALRTVRLRDAEHRRGLTVHFQAAALDP